MPSSKPGAGDGALAASGDNGDNEAVLPVLTVFALVRTDGLFGGDVFSSLGLIVGGLSLLGVFAPLLSAVFAVVGVFDDASMEDGFSSFELDPRFFLCDFGLFTTSFGEALPAVSGESGLPSFGCTLSRSGGFRGLLDLAEVSVFVSFAGVGSVVFTDGFVGGFVLAVTGGFGSLAVGGRLALGATVDGGLVDGDAERRFALLPEVVAANGVPPVRGGTAGVFSVVDDPSVLTLVDAVTVMLVPFPPPPPTFPPALVPTPPTPGRLSTLSDMVTSH